MNKKNLVILLSISHLLCVVLGYCLGTSRTESENVTENTLPTKAIVETTSDTETAETTEQTISTVMPTITVETMEEPTEETQVTNPEDIPAYSPSFTTPSVTQPPAAQPPATEVPATQPPFTEAPPSFDTERD